AVGGAFGADAGGHQFAEPAHAGRLFRSGARVAGKGPQDSPDPHCDARATASVPSRMVGCGTCFPPAPRMNPTLLRHGMNLWPPFLFTGIHVAGIAADWSHARVELRMRPWNRNYVRTHFGGSLFAMSDPFWMLLLMQQLGRDYYVWDQSGSIDFLKPGRGTVWTEFRITPDVLAEVRQATAGGAKHLHWFENEIRDAAGDVVARVRKQVYVRRKPDRRPARDGAQGAAGTP